MFNIIKTSFKIDMVYAINSFIYNIKRIPILGVFLPNDMYQRRILKKVIQYIILIYRFFKTLFFKFLYFFFIYFIFMNLFSNNRLAFIYIFIIFTLIGIIISNKLFDVESRDYFSVILFGIDSKKYFKANLLFEFLDTLIFNFIFLFVFGYLLSIDIYNIIFLTIFSSFFRLICNYIHLRYYQKYGALFLTNNKYLLLVFGLLCTFILPYFNIYISLDILFIITVISIILGIISYRYLDGFSDYKLIYKRINTEKAVMTNDDIAYSKQNNIEIKDKDKFINQKKILNKKGYDLFNTIFFERHKQILLRSANVFSIVILCVIIFSSILLIVVPEFKNNVNDLLHNHLSVFVFIMYFINRGMVVTKAMFFNCDHAMLTFNFYRDPKVILNLFKKRLITIVKINLIPSLVIAIGLMLLLFISGGSYLINYIMIFLFIIILSVFFSVHYLILYYLLQPFNKDLKINDFRYSIISFLTYFISYNIVDIKLSSTVFCFIGIVFTLLYIVISLIVVYKIAYKTFRLK